MKIAVTIGGPASGRGDWEEQVEYAVEAEKLGVDSIWSAEAWGMDAVTTLAFLAARTRSVALGTGIMQISARAPAMTAMTALTMAAISKDRFRLGLGASGPQVVEGLHGQSFADPVGRMRETIEIARLAFAGEKLAHPGKHHLLPRPGGEGKALRLSQPANPAIPIYLATLSPKALRLTGELADGWLGTSFIPTQADAHLAHIAAGAAAAGRSLADLDIGASATAAVTDDPAKVIAAMKPQVAFVLGAMGSPKTNFYNAAFRRAGYEDAAVEVQKLWVDGKRAEAVDRVPDEMVHAGNLIGDAAMIRSRVQVYRDAGVNTLMAAPSGRSLEERLSTLGAVVDIIRG
ncbi:MAG: LLM class flavin-dependent oxidoreductase [Candidatus Binatia bacterium]|nr:LLM class flavin-dependent oxidoreductase [Candidatus Binatia bacterium]